ncbi:MAG: hypothetical protein WC994_09030 [Brumimicrobium sp.]
MKNIIFVLALLAFSTACEQKIKTGSENELVGQELAGSAHEKIIQEIESRIDEGMKVQSLQWEKQTEQHGSEFIEVEAYLNPDGKAIKIVEYYILGNYQPQGEKIYYLNNGEIVAYRENIDFWVDSLNTNYREIQTFFENGKAIKSQTRVSISYDDIQFQEWEDTELDIPSLEKINQILNGEGRFQPHFISVIKGDNATFLLLGEPKELGEERYTTAVRVDVIDDFMQDLLKNQETYKFKPVDIQFRIEGNGITTPIFRVLTNIQWKE